MTDNKHWMGCPFCGSFEAYVQRQQCDDGDYGVLCHNCGAFGPSANSKSAARKAWNKQQIRAERDELRQHVRELEHEIEIWELANYQGNVTEVIKNYNALREAVLSETAGHTTECFCALCRLIENESGGGESSRR